MKCNICVVAGLFFIYTQSASASPTDVLIYDPNTGVYSSNGGSVTIAANPCGQKQGTPCVPQFSNPAEGVCYLWSANDVGGMHCMFSKWRGIYDASTEKSSCVCKSMWTCGDGYFGTPQENLSDLTCYACGYGKKIFNSWIYYKQTDANNGPITGITSTTGYNTTADTCVCNIGYYNSTGLPGNVNRPQCMWCGKCPDNGTTAKTDSEKTDCYIPKGTSLSNDLGRYKFTSNCYYSN